MRVREVDSEKLSTLDLNMAEFIVFNPDWESTVVEATLDDLEALGQLMQEAAEANCPVRTGNLLSSIYHVVDEHTGEIELGATASYAEAVEERVGFLRNAVYQDYGRL